MIVMAAWTLLALAICAISRPGRAEDAAAATSRAVASLLEERGRELLGRHLAPRQFQIFATVDAAEALAPPKSIYLPQEGGAGALKSLDNYALRSLAQKVRLDVYIDPKVSGQAREKLAKLLLRGLALRPAAGDRIGFEDMTLADLAEQSPAASAGGSDGELRVVQDDLRALRFRMEDLRKERDDLSRDLSLARSEIQRRAGESKTASDQAAPASAVLVKPDGPQKIEIQTTGGGDAKVDSVSSNLVTGGVGALLAVALLVGLVLIGGSFRSLGKSVSEAVTAIAKALESVGADMTSSRSDSMQVDIKQSAAEAAAAGRADPANAPRGRIALENVERRLKELKQVLTAQLTGKGETAALAQIDQLLSTPAGVELGVAMLEVLGDEAALRLFGKLGKQKQGVVTSFLRKGSYTIAKEERLLEAGDKLKMMMFVESFGGIKGDLDGRVVEAMIRVQDKDLAGVCMKLPKDALPRLLLYCEPRRIARILDLVKRVDEAQYDQLVSSVTQIPEARFKTDKDDQLSDRLTQAVAGADSDLQREYLEFYRDIVEESADKLKAEVADRLGTQHPKVKEFLDETVVSYATLFKLAREYLEEVVDYLGNRDLAALMLHLEPAQKRLLAASLDERRLGLVEDESKRVEGRGKRQAEQAFEQAKRLVVSKIVAIKGDGLIGDLLDQPPASNSATGFRAA
jgi:hypothetical protein